MKKIFRLLKRWINSMWWGKIFLAALRKLWDIDGEIRAAAFGYYGLFSLLPLAILLVTVGSLFVKPERAATIVLEHIEQYLPLNLEKQQQVIEVVSGVIKTRGEAGVVALLVLVWGGMRFFYVLVCGVNQAWSTQSYNWWRLPVKNLTMIGITASALLLGVVAPALIGLFRDWFPFALPPVSWIFDIATFLVPLLVLFYGFTMLYKLSPRRPTRFSEVWFAALIVTLLLRLVQFFFLLYLEHFRRFQCDLRHIRRDHSAVALDLSDRFRGDLWRLPLR